MSVVQDTARATEALDRLIELTLLLNDDMTRSLARQGLTVPRTHLLWLLHHEGASTQRALSDALKVTPRNITGLVDGLVGAGLVTREAHPTDRRATLVTLTDPGSSMMATMADAHQELAARLFDGIPADQLRGFVSGIDGVTERLRSAIETAGEG